MSWLRSKSYSLKGRKDKAVKEKMDALLRGILSSDNPDSVKRALIQKISEKGGQDQNINAVIPVLDITSKWFLDGASDFERASGLEVYKAWAKNNLVALEKFFNKDFLLHILSKKFRNGGNSAVLMAESMRMLQRSSLFINLCTIIKAKAIGYVREHPYLLCLKNFAEFLFEFKECIPVGDFGATFCSNLIHSMSLCNYPEDESQILNYIQDVNKVASLLQNIWSTSDAQTMKDSLPVIFNIISSDNDVEPSVCLGSIVQYLPSNMIHAIVRNVITDSKIDDKSMTVALQRIIDWLQWPTAKNVDRWVIGFLLGLASVQKYSTLITVTENKVDQIFEKLQFAPVREPGLNILSHMLLSFQHSPDAFHKILTLVPKIILQLKGENSAQSVKILTKLVELIHCLMYLHAGFPELYDPILTLIKEHPKPTLEVIKFKLLESKWTAHRDGMGYTPKVYQQKTEMGKTGLFNLGNTCYMNSILQSLFMCDSFRTGLLAHTPTEEQALVVKLQHVFAFLSHSQRPAYAPMNFLTASRPSWFSPGFQQDCSEFLKHLLDKLNEQECNAFLKRNTGKSAEIAVQQGENKDGSNTTSAKAPQTMIEQNFGGKMMTTFKCLNCGAESTRSETFMDLPLAFPDSGSSSEKSLVGGDSKMSRSQTCTNPTQRVPDVSAADTSKFLHLSDLLKHYLEPEKLTGDNKYHCDKCDGLQDGERRIRIAESPEYLFLTLLRFSYDTKLQTRSKIFQEVKYPKTLLVPVDDPKRQDVSDGYRDRKDSLRSAVADQLRVCGVGLDADCADVYGLCSVIIHSGTSSDCGHYYCYARHSMLADPEAMSSKLSNCSNEDEIDFLQDKWFLFNDSHVSHTSYDSFSNVTQRFTKDTAYVLVYRKVNPDLKHTVAKTPDEIGRNDQPLRTDLRSAVNQDNKMFLQEQENAAKKNGRKRTKMESTSAWYSGWRDDDDKGGPCGGGGGGSLGDMDTSGAKYVF